jgi:uncharacterized membrane protein YjgN (DUF898 family)
MSSGCRYCCIASKNAVCASETTHGCSFAVAVPFAHIWIVRYAQQLHGISGSSDVSP